RQIIALARPTFAILDNRVDRIEGLDVRVDGKVKPFQRLDAVFVAFDVDAFDRADAVGEQAQPALGAQLRVEQLERAGRRVARIGEWLETFGDAVTVELGQIFAVHVDFATGLEEGD